MKLLDSLNLTKVSVEQLESITSSLRSVVSRMYQSIPNYDVSDIYLDFKFSFNPVPARTDDGVLQGGKLIIKLRR